MNANSRTKLLLRHLTCAAMCLALCLYLPFLTGQIPQIGRALSPMHIPVLLAGFLCGPWWAMVVGLSAPMLRHSLFLMPPLVTAIAMSFELAAYGLFSGLLYQLLPKKRSNIYVSLILAMLGGRIVWGIAMTIISGVTGSEFGWAAFIAGAFTSAVPGIIVHIILIPVLVMSLAKSRLFENGALRRLISAEKRATSALPTLEKTPHEGIVKNKIFPASSPNAAGRFLRGRAKPARFHPILSLADLPRLLKDEIIHIAQRLFRFHIHPSFAKNRTPT